MTTVARRVRLGTALACILASCSGSVTDPGYVAVATNMSGGDVVIRDGAKRWRLPTATSGLMVVTIGNASDASPVDYEILDPETCRVLGQVHVEFVAERVTEVVVDPTGGVGSRRIESAAAGLEHLATTDLCPVPGG